MKKVPRVLRDLKSRILGISNSDKGTNYSRRQLIKDGVRFSSTYVLGVLSNPLGYIFVTSSSKASQMSTSGPRSEFASNFLTEDGIVGTMHGFVGPNSQIEFEEQKARMRNNPDQVYHINSSGTIYFPGADIGIVQANIPIASPKYKIDPKELNPGDHVLVMNTPNYPNIPERTIRPVKDEVILGYNGELIQGITIDGAFPPGFSGSPVFRVNITEETTKEEILNLDEKSLKVGGIILATAPKGSLNKNGITFGVSGKIIENLEQRITSQITPEEFKKESRLWNPTLFGLISQERYNLSNLVDELNKKGHFYPGYKKGSFEGIIEDLEETVLISPDKQEARIVGGIGIKNLGNKDSTTYSIINRPSNDEDLYNSIRESYGNHQVLLLEMVLENSSQARIKAQRVYKASEINATKII